MSRTWSELLGDEPTEADEPERTGFFGRMRESLAKSRRALTEQIATAGFDPGDDEAWERLEEALIRSDVGVPATAELVRRLEARGDLAAARRRARGGGGGAVRRRADARARGQAERRPRRRRQRHGQDDDDRQAGAEARRARALGARRCGGHVPRRRRGAARDLGRARRRGLRRLAARRRSRPRSPSTPSRRRAREGTTSSSSTPPAACTRRRT